MISRIRFDISWRDLAYGIACCVRPGRTGALAAHTAGLEAQWGDAGDALVCLSVRSAFDLALRALALPRGSEVITSAVTIPHMLEILAHHGLIAVPIDLDLERMALLGRIEDAITPRTRAVLVAHLFGARLDMAPIVEIAHRHGLIVFEDCAQAFDGPRYRGHAESDLALFSFGPIKHRTALGGALVRVRDRALRAAMRRHHAGDPVQRRTQYLARLLKYCVLKLLSNPAAYTVLVAALRLAGRDHDAVIGSLARGFSGPELFALIRRRPSLPLVQLLRRRLATFDERAHARRLQWCRAFADQIAPHARRLGQRAQVQTFWLFPICVDDPDRAIDAIRRVGFDATRSQSALQVVAPVSGRPGAPQAARWLAGVVYLPVAIETPPAALSRMARVLGELAANLPG